MMLATMQSSNSKIGLFMIIMMIVMMGAMSVAFLFRRKKRRKRTSDAVSKLLQVSQRLMAGRYSKVQKY